jgi:hypothetical protein
VENNEQLPCESYATANEVSEAAPLPQKTGGGFGLQIHSSSISTTQKPVKQNETPKTKFFGVFL